MARYYSVLDADNKRIGLAKAKPVPATMPIPSTITTTTTTTTTAATATTELSTERSLRWSNCTIAGEGAAGNPEHCLVFYDEKTSGDELDCCWTADHHSRLPSALENVVTVHPNGTIDIRYGQEQNTEQILVPLISPSQTKIQFWIEPFAAHCKLNLRIDFSYSRNEINDDDEGCSICANTIIGTTHLGDGNKRHRVMIDGESASMTVYEQGSDSKKSLRSFAVCPVKLRHLMESNMEQFYLPFRLLNIRAANNRSELPACFLTIRLESEIFEEVYKLLVKDGPKELV